MPNIPDDSNLKGSVKDLGSFSEGNCFEVETKKPTQFFQMTQDEPFPSKGMSTIWLFCSSSPEIKSKFMNLVIKLRLKKQHQHGLWLRNNLDEELRKRSGKPTIADLMTEALPKAGGVGKVENALDGYWVKLQDWSTCSKKCGGGLQYLHLMCIPPKKGGKPCEGESLRSKPCNEEPCPEVGDAKQILQPHGREKMNKPIVKMMPISARPLRYDKCHIKETDAIFTKNDKKYGNISNNPMKIPGRVVMNERSISVYTDETLVTNLGTFILERTSFSRIKDRKHCFLLTSVNLQAEFCNIDTNPNSNFVEEWDYDFNLFKHQCHTDRPTISLDEREEKELEDEFNNKVESAKMDVVRERTKRLKDKVEEAPATRIEKTQAVTLMAIQKELKLEELLEKEEAERESAEERELRAQIEKEKRKDDCLIKSIKEKELEDQHNVNKANQENEIHQLQEEAKQEILAKRAQIRAKLAQMRKRAARKKKLLNGEIQSLRSQVADQLGNDSKEGNANNCYKPTKENDNDIHKYCSKNYMDNPQKYVECIAKDTFCYVCCETEFGSMHVKARDNCYDKCEDKKPGAFKVGGRWQWVSDITAGKD